MLLSHFVIVFLVLDRLLVRLHRPSPLGGRGHQERFRLRLKGRGELHRPRSHCRHPDRCVSKSPFWRKVICANCSGYSKADLLYVCESISWTPVCLAVYSPGLLNAINNQVRF